VSATQYTLELEATDAGRERPGTFRYCEHCETWVLRSRWEPHDDHHYWATRWTGEEDSTDSEDAEGDAKRVGAYYDITISYSVDYRFRVPAWSDHEAEDIAEDWVLDATPADRMKVHTEKREIRELFEDDSEVPEDYDPYGSELLHEAVERAEDGAGGECE